MTDLDSAPASDSHFADHCVLDFRASALACRNCGHSEPVTMPISVTVLLEMSDAFREQHSNCAAVEGIAKAEGRS